MFRVDLNADLGESFGAYKIGCDKEVLEQVTSANVACGWHAGDPVVLDRTLAMAKEKGVCVGAHPGYPDLMGFGRRDMKLTPDEEYAYTLYQLGAFAAFAKKNGLEIQHLKAHGAMYNTAGKDITLALAICRAVKDRVADLLRLLGPVVLGDDHARPGGQAHEEADEHVDDGVHGAHGGEGLLPHVVPHHPGVHGVIELLEQVAEEQRHGKADQQAVYVAAGHVHVPPGEELFYACALAHV